MPACEPALIAVVALLVCGLAGADYYQDRAQFLQDEDSMFMGGQLTLSPKEQAVNDILMKYKVREYQEGFASKNLTFNPARHFFHAKKDIENSDVFKVIHKMPKGALLHGHDLALVSTEYLLKNITYRENLYICLNNGVYLLHFFAVPDESCAWKLLSDVRASSDDVAAFDSWLGDKLSLVVPNPAETYKDINAIWSRFNDLFNTLFNMLSYRPVFEDYFYEVLNEFYQDNVMYIEFRAVMSPLYELDGREVSSLKTAQLFEAVTRRFVSAHPRFLGARVIYAPVRRVDNGTVLEYLEFFKTLRDALPDFVVGFDLVGQEDMGAPLMDLIEPILMFQRDGARFFFHAGETNWEGETDLNLIDAILLNTSRIGHGYALNKHPLAMKLVKERGIAIEVNPLSNQVLMLVADLRNHPAAALIADNYPVVIACDDPSLWGAKGLSYDFYEAFMGMTGVNADLRTLKQLAINSITYSAMPPLQKVDAMKIWEEDWDVFLDEMLLGTRNRIVMTSPKFAYKTDNFVHENEAHVILA